MKKKYLITGGTGFIGVSLVKKLVNEGADVRVFDNDFRGNVQRLKEVEDKIEFVKGDIRDKDEVKNACKEVDSIIHLAAINGTKNFYTIPDVVLEVGVKGILNIIDGAIAHAVPEIFVASSSEVYQNPPVIPTPENVPMIIPDPFNARYSYSGMKMISELLLIHNSKHFQRSIIFRPHNVYGPDMGYEHIIPEFAMKIKELVKKNAHQVDLHIQGTGKETRSFIFIEDFVNGLMVLMDKGNHNEIYNIGVDKEHSASEIAHLVGNYFKCSVNVIPGKLAEGSVSRRCPDMSKLTALGFNAKTDLETGILKTAEWYAKYGVIV